MHTLLFGMNIKRIQDILRDLNSAKLAKQTQEGSKRGLHSELKIQSNVFIGVCMYVYTHTGVFYFVCVNVV